MEIRFESFFYDYGEMKGSVYEVMINITMVYCQGQTMAFYNLANKFLIFKSSIF